MSKQVSVLAFALFFAMPFFVSAQTNPASSPPEGGATTETVVVADVGIDEARILSQDKNSFRIAFDIHNGAGAQPQIRYKVELVEKQRAGEMERQILRDTEWYDEVVSLGENSTVSKEIRYDAPEFLTGTYELVLIAENESGLPLGRTTLNTVSLSGSGRYLAADHSKCVLTIENDKPFAEGKKRAYPLLLGVDILPTEALSLVCSFENKLGKNVTVKPVFKITERSSYGKEAAVSPATDTPTSFSTGETKIFRTRIPAITTPQSYDVYMTLNDERGVAVSETIKAHFVVRGESATIQNALFDKGSYASGDTASVRFFWSPSADGFPGSRIEGGTAITGGATVYAMLKNGNGTSCADPVTMPLSEDRMDTTLSFKVKRDCEKPALSLTIKNGSGTVLASQEMSMEASGTGATPAEKPGNHDKDVARSLAFALFLVTAIAGVALVGAALARKRRGGPRPPIASLLVLFAASMFMAGAQDADALTISSWGKWEGITAVVDLDKSTYVTGETIVASGSVWYTNCANQPYGWYYLHATHGSETKPVIGTTAVMTEWVSTGECWFDYETGVEFCSGFIDSSDSSSGSTTFTATPSINSIGFTALGWRSGYSWGASGSIGYSVIAGALSPTASITAPTGDRTIVEGTSVAFSGSGTDPNGDNTITGSEWRDGNCSSGTLLSSQPGNISSFSTNTLSTGVHNVYLRFRDETGAWSTNCPSRTITVEPAPETLKVCLNSCSSGSSNFAGQTVELAPGDIRRYAVCYNSASGCSSATGDVTMSHTVFTANNTPDDAISPTGNPGEFRANSVSGTRSESVTVDYDGKHTTSLTLRVTPVCTSNCSAQAANHCANENGDGSFTTTNSCGVSESCPAGTGTRYCDFNWKEVTPGN